MKKPLLILTLVSLVIIVNAQPNPDTDYEFKLRDCAYLPASGPRILIDEGHNNLHKMNEGLLPLVKMLRNDGYRIDANSDQISEQVLEGADIYVIVNALHDSDVGNWVVPNPSAFSIPEIQALKNWVESGGSLLLVADHMPYGGAVQDLGNGFGIEWNNGFAIRDGQNWPPSVFNRESNTLKSSPVTDGDLPFERINSIATFTGSVFKAPEVAEIFLQFDNSHTILMPDTAWQFSPNTKTMNSEGWHQGAVLEFGKGRIVVLGEAAMITAQIVNDNFKVGINSPQAPENAQLALNIFHYLSRHKKYVDIDEILDSKLRQMEAAFREGRMKDVAAFYSDDAQILGPGRNDQHGRNEIDAYWEAIQGMEVDWKLTSLERKEVGIQVHEIGTSELTYISGGQQVTSTTRFYLIWELEKGDYRIKMDFYHAF